MLDPAILRAVGFVVGLAVTLLVGAVVPYVMKQTRWIVHLEAPSGIRAER